MPHYIFYHHICQWCYCSGDFLKKCASCRLVSYCTSEHQKYDWKIHKYLCQTVTKLNNTMKISLFNFRGNTQKEWNEHRTKVMVFIELLLRRKLNVFERQMILFPNVCTVCYQYNTVFLPCINCRCNFYCCEEHMITNKAEHEENCKALKLCFDVDLFLIKCNRSSIRNIDCNSLLKKTFPSSIDEFLEGACKGILEKCLASEEISFIFSLLYGLIKCNKNELYNLNVFNVHILGCNEHENNILKFVEIFFHWFPQLNKVNLVMIGPDCDTSSNDVINNDYKNGKTSAIKKIKNLYHEYIKESDFEHPNIVVAFNCGFAEFNNSTQDTWGKTIDCLMKMDKVILVITSYTQVEAENDISRVINGSDKIEKLDVIINADKNPFRSLRPHRDWESHSVFYLNNFISVLYIG
ncbi:hypothetical protein O3M35_005701 [Rhynocoris fuscipes]|uniref:MYND-type domain-containing protein n=1 Tax=Rhynocoris fuscipes TaxID=488301 RepID=A0AAW1DPI2_9HEMI